MDGAVLKLTILPFEDVDGVLGIPAGPPFIAQFNPETYTDTVEFAYAEQEQPQGEAGGEAKFKSVNPKKFSFELLLDGTGISPAPPPAGALDAAAPSTGLSVVAQLELFKLTVGFAGNIHRPRFLMLVWGRLIATTVLENYSIAYKLFSPAGLPIRATLTASFREHIPKGMGSLLKNLASPDIQHAHQVVEGDRLPTIVHSVYKDTAHYIDVARANRLDSIRALRPGEVLQLPPVR
jgi:nucleoid-associated protein YgaU